jgi:hypothetical protein
MKSLKLIFTLMNKYVFACEHPLLAQFIDNYTILEFDAPMEADVMKVPPLGFPVIQFHFGNESHFYNRDHLKVNSIVCGQMTKHLLLKPVSGTRLLGIDFKPYGLYNLLGFQLYGLIDSAIPADHFFPEQDVNQLIENLKQAENHASRIEFMTHFLVRQASKSQPKPHNVYDSLVDRMLEANGLVSLNTLLDSRYRLRNLQRYFKTHIGISPKLFLQVLRHKFVLQCYFENPGFSWHDPRLDGFYYDQSHFDRDFVKFTTQKPMEYLRLNHIMARNLI